jgi:hypothetical protein
VAHKRIVVGGLIKGGLCQLCQRSTSTICNIARRGGSYRSSLVNTITFPKIPTENRTCSSCSRGDRSCPETRSRGTSWWNTKGSLKGGGFVNFVKDVLPPSATSQGVLGDRISLLCSTQQFPKFQKDIGLDYRKRCKAIISSCPLLLATVA